MPCTRREVLGLGGLAIPLAFAGCSGVFGSRTDSVQTPIHRLLVENHTSEEHTVHLQLLDAGGLSYWRSVEVPVSGVDAEVITGTKLAPGFPRSAGEYTVLARLDASADWRRIDYSDESVPENACLEIVVTVEDETTLGFMSSVDEAVCDKRPEPPE